MSDGTNIWKNLFYFIYSVQSLKMGSWIFISYKVSFIKKQGVKYSEILSKKNIVNVPLRKHMLNFFFPVLRGLRRANLKITNNCKGETCLTSYQNSLQRLHSQYLLKYFRILYKLSFKQSCLFLLINTKS